MTNQLLSVFIHSLKQIVTFQSWKKVNTGTDEDETTVEAIIPFSTIAIQLKPLVRVLQIAGSYPIMAVRSNSKQNSADGIQGNRPYRIQNMYELISLKWSSPWMWYSYIVKIVMGLSICSFMLNLALGIPFPAKLMSFAPSFHRVNNSTSGNIAIYNSLSIVISSVVKLIEISVLFINSELFVRWLNKWSTFETDFLKCFQKFRTNGSAFTFDITSFRNVVLSAYFYIPTIIFLFGGYFAMLQSFTLHVPYFSFIAFDFASFALWVYPIMEETKLLILLKTTVLAVEQVRVGIKQGAKSGDMLPSDVIGWRKLLDFTRQQTKLLSSYIKCQQIMNAGEAIISCSLGLSYVLTSLGSENYISTLTSPGFMGSLAYCLGNFFRLYVKILFAEQLPAEEQLMASQILEIESECNDPATKIELKFFYNMLTQNTVAVNLGNYFSIDKKLLLQVGVQVVTYLIVIIQFQGTSNHINNNASV